MASGIAVDAVESIFAMARRSKHTTKHTAGELQARFEEVIAHVGGSYDNTLARRVLAVPIDGMTLGDRCNEIRKPRSSFYSQTFFEAMAVVQMLVGLDMDESAMNVERRDRPDIRVVFADRPALYVEHTNVAPYDGMPFARHLEEINHAVTERKQKDSAFRQLCGGGNLEIRLSDPGVGKRSEPDQVAGEIANLVEAIADDVELLKPNPETQPTLARYQANVFYRMGRVSNPTPCQRDGGWLDPGRAWIGERLRTALCKKREKARQFDPSLRPLWLLITLDAERELFPPFVSELVHEAMDGLKIAPYDRVAVSYSGAAPIII